VLGRPESPNGLLDVDRTHVRRIIRITESQQPPSRVVAPAKEIDEDGRVEQDGRQLTDPVLVRPPLLVNPLAGILVPIVAPVGNRANRRLDELPAVVVVQRTFDCVSDVRAAPSSAHPAIELADDSVVESYLYPHGHKLVHHRIYLQARKEPQ
jgi:hypothetical protein